MTMNPPPRATREEVIAVARRAGLMAGAAMRFAARMARIEKGTGIIERTDGVGDPEDTELAMDAFAARSAQEALLGRASWRAELQVAVATLYNARDDQQIIDALDTVGAIAGLWRIEVEAR